MHGDSSEAPAAEAKVVSVGDVDGGAVEDGQFARILIVGDLFESTALVGDSSSFTRSFSYNDIRSSSIGRTDLPVSYEIKTGTELIEKLLEDAVRPVRVIKNISAEICLDGKENPAAGEKAIGPLNGVVSQWRYEPAEDDGEGVGIGSSKKSGSALCEEIKSRYRIKPTERELENTRLEVADALKDVNERDVVVVYDAARKNGDFEIYGMEKAAAGESGTTPEKKNNPYRSAGAIVLRTTMRSISSEGGFAHTLLQDEECAKKCIAVFSIESVRRAAYNVRLGLSWEQLLRETVSELADNELLSKLKAIVITSHHDGVLTIVPDHANKGLAAFRRGSCVLHYVPDELEGTLERKSRSYPIALLAYVAASIAAGICDTPAPFTGDSIGGEGENAAVLEGVSDYAARGLHLSRTLLADGYGLSVAPREEDDGAASFAAREIELTPEASGILKREVADLRKEKGWPFSRFVSKVERLIVANKASLSIASLVFEEKRSKSGQPGFDAVRELSVAYIREGIGGKAEKIDLSAKRLPHLQIENLLTFERSEIEQLNNLRNVLKTYMADPHIRKPLFICVFGSPGAGKSFSVKEIAKSSGLKGRDIVECNLSQLSSYADLAGAFHRVANVSVEGGTPLVFFDEFDSTLDGVRFGWLKYFLAPMQDGAYRDGDREFTLGKSVFVFAGGTCSNHVAFESAAKGADSSTKVTDFLSRTRAFLDVMGINPRRAEDGSTSVPYLKRAVLLRSLILRHMGIEDENYLLDIDDRVLSAFLDEEEYVHDARSMEAIVNSSVLAPGSTFTPSCVVNNCLDLHVGARFNLRLRGEECFRAGGCVA